MLTDNQWLLTRVESSLPYPKLFPDLALLSDWDVTHKISQSLWTLECPPTLRHVKGHQDTTTPYAKLSLEAQLNVDADTKAGFFQCMYPSQCLLIPHLPSNSVQLHIAGKVICARLKQRIRKAATFPQYLAYNEK
jgi:hypothetical protein